MATHKLRMKQKNGDNGYDILYPETSSDQVIDTATGKTVADFINSKGKANGVASLDANGKVPSSQVAIPEMTAKNVVVADATGKYSGANVEAVLEEIGTALVGTTKKLVSEINAILNS